MQAEQFYLLRLMIERLSSEMGSRCVQVVAGATLGTVGLLLVYAPNDGIGIGVRLGAFLAVLPSAAKLRHSLAAVNAKMLPVM